MKMTSFTRGIPFLLFHFFMLSSDLSVFINGQHVSFEAIYQGSPVSNPGSVKDPSSVQLKCQFETPIVRLNLSTANLYVKNPADDSWVKEVICSRSNTAYDVSQGTKSQNILQKSSASCSGGIFLANITMTKSSPKYFRCEANTPDVYDETVDIILRTHTSASTPVIRQYPETGTPVREGVDMNFTCESTARPPPKLRFSYNGGNVPSSETSHVPFWVSISPDNASETSVLTWNTKANGAMNGEYLRCTVIDHPSGGPQGTQPMSVYFGPASNGNKFDNWNTQDGDKLLVCNFQGFGNMVYRWYNGSMDADSKLPASEQNYTLKKEDYSHVTDPTSVVFICEGTNTQNDGKSATSTFTVTIKTDIAPSPGVTAGNAEDPTDTPPLPGYAIGLIVSGVVLLVVVVLVIVALVYRNRQSPAAIKKKQAADRNGGFTNHNVSGTKSTPPDVIRNSYTAPDVPNSPATPTSAPYSNRYSQHVEDYADAIDDMPRSRRPVAYSMDELNDAFDGPPSHTMMSGPPGYQSSSLYSNDYPPQHDYSGYGAAC